MKDNKDKRIENLFSQRAKADELFDRMFEAMKADNCKDNRTLLVSAMDTLNKVDHQLVALGYCMVPLDRAPLDVEITSQVRLANERAGEADELERSKRDDS